MTVSDHRRKMAYEAGLNAGFKGLDRKRACTREPGTIYFDDWHDGYDDGQRRKEATERKQS